eukprot:COSAG05_NODE_210_length_14015_cov_3.851785_6_plen_178_part_00
MRATLCPAQYARKLRFSYRSAGKAVVYNHSQKAPRTAAGQPSDCKTLTDWARKVALAFQADCDAGGHTYSFCLKDCCDDGSGTTGRFPLSSIATLYKMRDELLAVRGDSSSSSRRPSAKASAKGSPAANGPPAEEPAAAPQKQRKSVEPVESPEQKAKRLLAAMGAEAAQQPLQQRL